MKQTKQPSPRSSHARKPFVNITNTAHLKSYGSVDSKPKNNLQIITSENYHHLQSSNSSANYETPVERIRSRKNSSTKSKREVKERCANHEKREAKHQITIKNTSQYYCLECCFCYAKQGHKVNMIESKKDSRIMIA